VSPSRFALGLSVVISSLLLGRPLPCQAQTPAPDDSAIVAAQAAAGAWLALTDGGQYEASWDSAAAVFRAAVTQADWQVSLLQARAPFGPVRGRKLLGAAYRTSLPGAPPGEYVVLQYEAEVSGGRKVVETVTPMRESDGRWRVSGYYIRPK
jgi:Protein of unknown function (DUF4019)